MGDGDAPIPLEPSSPVPAPTANRPWLQFHLSTALVLVFVAAALLWLNIGLHEHRLYGWPFHVFSYDFTYLDQAADRYYLKATQDDWSWLALDVFVAVLLLVAVGAACEHRLRGGKWRLGLATRMAEVVCVLACLSWNRAEPLHWYFLENLGPPLVARMLSWIALTFVVALAVTFVCEVLRRLRRETIKALGLGLLLLFLFALVVCRGLAGMRSSRQFPRHTALSCIEAALARYNADYGCYPPESSLHVSTGQRLYKYLCEPLSPGQWPYMVPPPECVHVRPDGTKELRGPEGHSYICRTWRNPNTGAVELVVEEIESFRVPGR
ncbi:MAG: hypothetical protein NTW87_30035 [Planctomycetota bacterium]|nr:hypothetical protein [Planctomycetota bacterium]